MTTLENVDYYYYAEIKLLTEMSIVDIKDMSTNNNSQMNFP